MIIALIASTGFLVGYIVYHVHVGEKSSGYTGLIAWIYFPLLITHVLLAFVTLPLVIVTLVPVFPARWIDIAGLGAGRCRSGFMFRSPACSFISSSNHWFPPPNLALSQ